MIKINPEVKKALEENIQYTEEMFKLDLEKEGIKCDK